MEGPAHLEGIGEASTSQPKRSYSNLIDQELAPPLSRSDSLQSLSHLFEAEHLRSGTNSGAQSPANSSQRPKRAKVQREVIELLSDSDDDDDDVIILEAWESQPSRSKGKGKGKAKVQDDTVRGVFWKSREMEKRKHQFLLVLLFSR